MPKFLPSIVLLAGLIFTCMAPARAESTTEERSFAETLPSMYSMVALDANLITMHVTNFGLPALRFGTGGMEYPTGSGLTVVYAAGVWIGAKVEGEIRVTTGWYQFEFGPGPIFDDGSWPDVADTLHRVYKIVRDDTTSFDYANWPSQFGAPVDAMGRPKLTGEQTLWCVYNDADSTLHTAHPGSTEPLGVEVQQTAYAFNVPGALSSAAIVELKIINELDNRLDSAYIALWSDPDIGNRMDDLTGCDPALDIGFAYNGGVFDAEYGDDPPCVGFDFLKGPKGDDGGILGMTAFAKHSHEFDPTNALESYNMMRGLARGGGTIVDPTTGEVTTFQVPGDPVTGTGWLDAPPTDKRFVMSSGPFTVDPGDTQTVVVAAVVGRGSDRLESISVMKTYDRVVQAFYNSGYSWPDRPRFDAPMGENGPLLRSRTNIVGNTVEEMPADGALKAYPNPGSGSISISYSARQPGTVRMEVYDAAGRLVHSASRTAEPGADLRWVWDGRNESGRSAPQGIYFIRVIQAGDVHRAKVILLRQ